jgi:hypothetical protein
MKQTQPRPILRLRVSGLHFPGFRPRYGPLRLWTLLLGLLIAAITAVPAGAASEGRSATLVVESDETCVHKTGSDHMVSTDKASFLIPEGGGPVKLEGTYNLTGSFAGGYQMSGRSVYQGEVKGGELILRFGQWYFQGAPMASSDPEMPSDRKPVRIALVPDAKVVIKFNGAHADKAPCSGTVVYRLLTEAENQTWEVSLTGDRYVIHVAPMYLLNPGAGQWTGFYYFHGVTFSYVLSAEFVITKKNGVWTYTSGFIKKAEVAYVYTQKPELYKVNRTYCHHCESVKGLQGKPIRGEMMDNSSVILHWPEVQPTVVVQAQLAVKCRPGPEEATCENLRKYAEYGMTDDDFLQRAKGHTLPLKQGPIEPIEGGKPTPIEQYSVLHKYKLSRVK